MSDTLLDVNKLCLQIGEKILAENISFSLEANSRTAIIGPNGAGKTTLLKTILGIQELHAGSISVAGHSIEHSSEQEWAQRVAYVPQQSQLQFPVPVADVIAWSRYALRGLGNLQQADKEAIESVLELFELQDLRDKPFNQLSGGEQRRVLLARSAASVAPLILLDEPTAHLDMHYILILQNALLRLQEQGKTLLMVLHDMRDVSACAESVLVLGNKQLFGPDNLDELVNSGVVQDVYGVSINMREQYTFEPTESP